MARKTSKHGPPSHLTYDKINRPWVVYADGYKKIASKVEAAELAANTDCEKPSGSSLGSSSRSSFKMDDSPLAQARIWLGFLERARGEDQKSNEALQAFDTLDVLLSPTFEDDKALIAKQQERLAHCEQYALGRKLLTTLQGLLLRRQVSFNEWSQIFRDAIEGKHAEGGLGQRNPSFGSSLGASSFSPLSKGVLPPLQGRITSRFGEVRPSGRTHKGVDIAVPVGTSVSASWNGKIAKVGEDDGYGRYVVVDYSWRDVFGREPGWFDDSHVEVLYAHLSEVALPEDQVVHPGDVLALSGASGRVRGEHGGAHLHVEAKLVQDVMGFHDAELVVDPLWLFSEGSIVKGEPAGKPRGQSPGLVQQGAFKTSDGGALPPGSRVNVVVTDSGDVVIGGKGKTNVELDANVQLPLTGTSGASHHPAAAPASGIQMASYTPPPTSGEQVSRRERVPAPFQEVPKDEWGFPKVPKGKELPKHKKGKPAPAPVPPPSTTKPQTDGFGFQLAPPKGVPDFFKPKNLEKAAVQTGEAVVEHGPTALEVGGKLVALGGGATAAIATAAAQPEIAIPAAAIGAAGGGVSALGSALKGEELDAKALVEGASGVADMAEFFGGSGSKTV